MLEDLREVLAVGDLSWQDGANCKGANADLFFPERGAFLSAVALIMVLTLLFLW